MEPHDYVVSRDRRRRRLARVAALVLLLLVVQVLRVRRMPDRLVLLSPAIGVTAIARFACWHRGLSFMPLFEGLRWQNLDLEYDPYKYNSFPKNAGSQTHRLTRSLQDGVERLQGVVDELTGAP